jgi:YD repeat-containing protein
MRIKHLFFLAATAVFAFTACEDPIEGNDPGNGNGNGNGEANFWTTYQLAPKGVKSISENGFIENYDNNGRLISTSSESGSTTYTYNAEGYVSKIESQRVNWEGKTENETQTFEFNNGDKFLPIPMGPGSIFHIFENGLVKGLSKITFESNVDSTIVMEFKFNGNKMTASTTGGYWTWDEQGNDIYETYKDVVIEYQGNYPYKLKGEHEFIGPITYQANGQFDTYTEGFYSWDPEYPDFITTNRTRTVNKNFKDKLLIDREVSEYFNEGESAPWNVETIACTYNEKGDITLETVTNTAPNSENYETTFEYEYDSKGNWIKCTSQMRVTNNPQADPRDPWVSERVIVYY